MHIRNIFAQRRGQSLIEILIALGIGIVLIGGVTALIGVNLRSETDMKMTQIASSLTQDVSDAAKSLAEANWQNIYALPKGPANPYYLSSSQVATAGKEPMTVEGYSFNRYFYVENVSRTQCGIGAITANATTTSCDTNFPLSSNDIADDPSTQKITVVVEWGSNRSVAQVQYVSRTKNAAIRQTDWSGAAGDNSVLVNPNRNYATSTGLDATSTPGSLKVVLPPAVASTTPNVDPVNHWAWNDAIGWIDFATPGTAGLNGSNMFGYASSSMGYIAFDCSTTPSGNTCASVNFKVSNDGNGGLSGWAYNDVIGWISFDSVTSGSAIPYAVTVNPVTGEFSGWAYNDVIGWISFDSVTSGSAIPYKVQVSWNAVPASGDLTSPIFDLGSSVALNAVIWKGSTNNGAVKFQIATSNSASGPWTYLGPGGTSGTNDMYGTSPGASTMLNPKYATNVRYVRYRVVVQSDPARTLSPSVDDIIINCSL